MLAAARERLVAVGRRLEPDGLAVGTAGNVSVRDGDRIAITPSGIGYERLTPADVVVVDRDGALVDGDGEPSTELPLHLAAYRADVGAVVHTHPPHVTALSTVVDELPPIHYLIADLGGAVPVVAYATPGSETLAAAVAGALTDRTAVILGNHGAVTVGDTLGQAYTRARLLEWLASLYHRARLLGEPALVADHEIQRLRETMTAYLRRGSAPDEL